MFLRLGIEARLPALKLAPGAAPVSPVCRREIRELDKVNPREESMTTLKAMRLASVVTAINVLVATGFSVAAIVNPQYLVPAAVPTEASLLLALYAAAPRIALALFALGRS